MKKFYLHNGTDQQGPFDIEDLRVKNITKETSIWFEGLPEWTTADKIDELKELFNKTTPPPFTTKTTTPPPIQKPPTQHTTGSQQPAPKKKSTLGVILQSIGAIGVIVIIAMIIISKMNSDGGGSTNTDSQTYQEKVMTVEEIERSQPTNFLTADGNYNRNFWGNKIKVHGKIKNNATVASYKDAVIRVTYYSKTKTELGSKEFTIYDIFPPHSEVMFELKIENYKDVNTIGWDVVEATAN
jgi:hypothetical protein